MDKKCQPFYSCFYEAYSEYLLFYRLANPISGAYKTNNPG